MCLEKTCVPKSFKSSLIRPHIKKHDIDANTLKNYRPVSNLPFISKALEKVVDVQLGNHLSQTNLHEKYQSAYRKFYSTETALLKVQNDIVNSLDQNDVIILVMLDLSAAFDTIDHKTLLNCLERQFGIAGKPLEFCQRIFTGSLSNCDHRWQTVKASLNGIQCSRWVSPWAEKLHHVYQASRRNLQETWAESSF